MAARWQQMPDWLHIGTRCVSTISGREYTVADIDKTRPDGLALIATGAPEYMRQDHELQDITEMVTRGYMIVYGYTPPELADGFRHSRIDYENGKLIWLDAPESKLGIELEKRYNQIKPTAL